MASVQLGSARFAMPPLAPGGELVLDSGGGRLPTADEALLLGVDHRHLERHPTALPYRYQSTYDRVPQETEQRVAVLDNGRLRATFLLDQGGRLWSLTDLEQGRELLHQPDVLHVANLALRNAWFAGGVEWNLGVTGHWGLTCEPVCAGIVGDDVLRLWAHERILGITWRLDVWLPDGATALFTHAVIHNPTEAPLPVYWWSNIAVPQDHDTRVVVDAERAFHFGYAYTLHEVGIPLRDGHDVTYPQRHRGCADYFYATTAEHPWIASVGADGYGLAQASTSRLVGRKMFTWGDGRGGRTWQRWLSGDGAYAEIQAGLARTQLEHLALAPGETWRFTESYGPVRLPDPSGDWADVVAAGRRLAVDPEQLDRAHAHLTSMEDLPVRDDWASPAAAHGWGALEVAAGHRAADPATPFGADHLSPEQQAWLTFARTGELDPALQTSALVGPQWRRRLQSAPAGWLRDLLLGHAEHAAGHTDRARELWHTSAAEHPTPDAWRALGLTATDADDAVACLVQAHELGPRRPRIAVEAITALLDHRHPERALELIDHLPSAARALPRTAYLEAVARVRTGDADGAAELLGRPLVLPDLREGDLGLDQLWDEFQTLRGTTEPLPEHYDFRMAVDETAPRHIPHAEPAKESSWT